jgi:hydrogenase maturation protein HypF
LAGVRQRVNYEGQAAVELEALVDEAEDEAYSFGLEQNQIQVRSVIEALIKDVKAGVQKEKISARFHNGLANVVNETVKKIHTDTGIRSVVLSGGVWQNITLLKRSLRLLDDNFGVHIHREVPTNDGGLSLGQAVIAASRMRG